MLAFEFWASLRWFMSSGGNIWCPEVVWIGRLGSGVVVRLVLWRRVEGMNLKCTVVMIKVLGIPWAELYCIPERVQYPEACELAS